MKTAKKRPFARLITADGTFITFVFCGNLPILHHDLTNVITSIIKMLSWHSEAEGKGQEFPGDFLVANRDVLGCYSCPH